MLVLVAQLVLAQGTEFEAASIKVPDPAARMGNLLQGGPGTSDPTRFTATNAAVTMILTRAFEVRFDQLSAPGWASTTRFDIAATVPPGATKDQMDSMLRNLLAERLHMTYHVDKKEFPVYELTVAKGGSKLKKSASQLSQLGTMNRATCQGNRLTAKGRDAAGIAQAVGTAVGARVVDKTGLTGIYDVDLFYTPPGGPSRAIPNCEGTSTDAPIVFEAVEKQLGLKLEKTTAMLDVIVIDHMDKTPSAD